MQTMRRFLLGFLLGLVLLPLCAFLYVYLGYAPVATAAPPFPLERKLAGLALHARIAKEAPAQPGVPETEENLLAGAQVYRDQCAMCHGMRGQAKTAAAKGMFPAPPQLLEGVGVTDDPAGETYWKVSNGIRLTGMPAYRQSLSPTQMWQVSHLLAHADKLPAAAVQALSQPSPAN